MIGLCSHHRTERSAHAILIVGFSREPHSSVLASVRKVRTRVHGGSFLYACFRLTEKWGARFMLTSRLQRLVHGGSRVPSQLHSLDPSPTFLLRSRPRTPKGCVAHKFFRPDRIHNYLVPCQPSLVFVHSWCFEVRTRPALSFSFLPPSSSLPNFTLVLILRQPWQLLATKSFLLSIPQSRNSSSQLKVSTPNR